MGGGVSRRLATVPARAGPARVLSATSNAGRMARKRFGWAKNRGVGSERETSNPNRVRTWRPDR